MKSPMDSEILNEIKKHYAIKKLSYFKNDSVWGRCYYTEGEIHLNKFLLNDKKKFLNTLFHEIGHWHCYKNGIWKNYHSDKNKLFKKDKILIKKIALKSERWIENWAEKEMKKWFPKISFSKGYYMKEKVKMFQKSLIKKLK